MALICCPECGREISELAPSCPHCGILKEDIQAMLVNMDTMSGEQQEKTNVTCNQEEDDSILIKQNALNELKKSIEAVVIAIQAIPKDQRGKQLLDATGILFDAVEAYFVANIEAMCDEQQETINSVCNQEENKLSDRKENALNRLKSAVEAMGTNIQAMPDDWRKKQLLETGDAIIATIKTISNEQRQKQLMDLIFAMIDILAKIPEDQHDTQMINVKNALAVYMQVLIVEMEEDNQKMEEDNQKMDNRIQIEETSSKVFKSVCEILDLIIDNTNLMPLFKSPNFKPLFKGLDEFVRFLVVWQGQEIRYHPTISILSDADRRRDINGQIDKMKVDRNLIVQLLDDIKTMHSEIDKMSDEQQEMIDGVYGCEESNQLAITINESTQFWDGEIIVYPTISILSDTDRIKFVNSWNREKNVENDEANECFDYKTGDVIEFGKRSGEPIEWIVLKKKDDKMLLLSKKGLYQGPFDTELHSVTWANCTLRGFLNSVFFNSCFDVQEKKRIIEVVTCDKDSLGRKTDKVFLLSIDEVKELLDNDKAKICMKEERGHWWWMRSVGNWDRNAAIVSSEGTVNENGYNVNSP